jgi:hypothetical protein
MKITSSDNGMHVNEYMTKTAEIRSPPWGKTLIPLKETFLENLGIWP